MSLDLANRIRNVTAVLGPTNTGKTHLAIERMLGHDTGLIGLPLRLLAREVYDKVAARVGADKVALITGEEKIKPESPRYYVCTVEAMPREADVDFLAIDEVQLAADPERGHVFTDRLLHVRGRQETLLLGAQTMREAISDLIPGANFISRPRLSKLTYAGEKKITRLPPRSALVAFSASEVYAIAELIRRQRGGAAVVLGALSPRTRNAQVALYQSGDVDFLVATDAIGMGLNLDVDHVAFAGTRKFDGQVHRALTPAELAQIGGRAGRHMNDGTFGVTGGVEPFSADVIERLETHTFDTVKSLQWRSRDLDFGSLDRLRDSLRQTPREGRLARARMADDTMALEAVSHDPEVAALAIAPAAVGRLWEVCQVPDYRKISAQNHAELVATLYKFLLTGEERIPVDWFANQVAFADRTDGDIDTLANRIAHIRTWTFVSNRVDWLADHEHWQERTKAIEDSLSDAMHERLTQRFVDRRTSALMRGLKEKDELYAEIADDGAVKVERHYVGRLKGFRFFADTEAEGIHGKAARNAAAHVLTKELSMRVRRVVAAKADAFKLTHRGLVLWREEEIARLEAGDDPLKPVVVVLSDEHLTGPDKEKVQERLNTWITELIARAAEAAGGDRRRQGHPGPGTRHRVPADGELRRPASRERDGGGARARPAGTRAAAQVRRALRRLQHLLPGHAEARQHRAGAGAVDAEERRRAWPRPRHHPGPAARRPHVAHAGRRHAGRVLSRRRLPPVRSARGAHRHAGAPRRPDPRAGVLAHERSQSVIAAQGRDRRRRLQGDARHDVDPRLLGRGTRQRAARARLLGGPAAAAGRATGRRCHRGSRRGSGCGGRRCDDRAGNCGAGRCAHPRSGGNRGDRDASGAGRRGGDRAGRERARHRSNPKRGRDGNASRTGQGR